MHKEYLRLHDLPTNTLLSVMHGFDTLTSMRYLASPLVVLLVSEFQL